MHPFTDTFSESVTAQGERGLIESIRGWLGGTAPRPPHGMGDDCAVLPARREAGRQGEARRQLVTVDPVIYGQHFDDGVSPQNAGAKLLRRNLSDIAAMGGRPHSAVVALMLDGRVKTAWVEGFYRGMARVARRHGVALVGGDVAALPGGLAATLTLVGDAPSARGSRVLRRDGARPGDRIYVTGRLGGSLASGRHFSFTPRLAEGAWLAGQREVRAMMDISDGLAKDLFALTPAGCAPALEEAALPRHRNCDTRSALCDGEDYELLLAVAARADRTAFEAAWRKKFPGLRLTCIGRFVPAGQLPPGALDLREFHGFEHLYCRNEDTCGVFHPDQDHDHR
ncbi:thiamine monophosphate kinase [Opitutaceae bacterium TAV1]|nr:thiamine monophosphate kinase [Opitutaceae bacterium TAV1]